MQGMGITTQHVYARVETDEINYAINCTLQCVKDANCVVVTILLQKNTKRSFYVYLLFAMYMYYKDNYG